jgi:hypothetical protein
VSRSSKILLPLLVTSSRNMPCTGDSSASRERQRTQQAGLDRSTEQGAASEKMDAHVCHQQQEHACTGGDSAADERQGAVQAGMSWLPEVLLVGQVTAG